MNSEPEERTRARSKMSSEIVTRSKARKMEGTVATGDVPGKAGMTHAEQQGKHQNEMNSAI